MKLRRNKNEERAGKLLLKELPTLILEVAWPCVMVSLKVRYLILYSLGEI